MSEQRPVTIDSLPTMTEVWMMLRSFYGKHLVEATVVAVIDDGCGNVTTQKLTFPRPDA